MSTEEIKFVEEQPEVIEAFKAHRKRYAEVMEASRKIMQEARKVVALVSAYDSCNELQWEHEDVSEADNKLLLKYTNLDSEAWFWRLNNVQECLQEAILQKCSEVNLANYRHIKLQSEARQNTELDQARAKAREKFQAQQQQPKKPRRGRPPLKKS